MLLEILNLDVEIGTLLPENITPININLQLWDTRLQVDMYIPVILSSTVSPCLSKIERKTHDNITRDILSPNSKLLDRHPEQGLGIHYWDSPRGRLTTDCQFFSGEIFSHCNVP